MNRIKFLLAVTAISFVPLLNCCVKDPPPVVEEPEPDLTETILRFLKSIDTYDIGEHSCTVETSTDSYDYPVKSNFTESQRVPIELIDTMSTLGVMETVLENPIWAVCTMGVWISTFLGTAGEHSYEFYNYGSPGLLQKLYDREDAASLLVERFTNMYVTCSDNNYRSYSVNWIDTTRVNKDDWVMSASFMAIQSIIAEDPILRELTKEDLYKVSVHVVRTYILTMETKGWTYPSKNTVYAAAWLATRIMETNGYLPFNVLYGEGQTFNRGSICRYIPMDTENYARLMLCFNNFIQEEL